MAHMEPKVTGLSPMTGPPGTKITVRGENLGQSSTDIIRLTINGADCLPYLEWKSTKKIITRCTRVIGNGDVIVTTNSGGVGSCDVQFNCYEENVGLTDDSAVWVDEIDYQTPGAENNFNIAATTDEYSVEISSARYRPQMFLVKNHPDASLDDLAHLKNDLENRIANKNDTQAIDSESNRSALLKSKLPVIMECLHILERLSKVIATSRDTSIDSIAKSIKEGLAKTHELFDPLLKQNSIVQAIESSMQVFCRKDGSFFDLPRAIEDSMKQRNYDSVVKEVTNVLSRLKIIAIEPELKLRISQDIHKKVRDLRATISNQLLESCRSCDGERNIDEIKKLINHLNRLGEGPSFDVWIALEEISGSLISKLTESFERNLQTSLSEAKQLEIDKSNRKLNFEQLTNRDQIHPIVNFVQSAIEMFQRSYYDIITLGQSYFDPKDEFACRDDVRAERYAEFHDTMITNPIIHLCSLLRLVLIYDLEENKLDRILWPNYDDQKEIYWDWMRFTLTRKWLRMILNSVIACQLQLRKSSLPKTVESYLDDFKILSLELRRQSLKLLFKNAELTNKEALYQLEDWIVEVNDEFGSVTKLPHLFESNVIEVLVFAKETILKKTEPDEVPILKNVAVQAKLKELALNLINSFNTALDKALNSSCEYPTEKSLVLLASKTSSGIPTQLSNRLLITICNYQYTRSRVFPKLKSEFKKLLDINVEKVFEECNKKYRDYIEEKMKRFCLIKCSEFPKIPLDNESNIQKSDLQINLMIANSQIFFIAPQLVDRLMPDIINRTLEETCKIKL